MTGKRGQMWNVVRSPQKKQIASRVNDELLQKIKFISKNRKWTLSQTIAYLIEIGVNIYDKKYNI